MRRPASQVDRILEALNPPQREAVLHERGPLLVLAGAGSGKTRVITHRIAMLLARGCPPDGILAITFTNKAADEMKARTEALCGMKSPWISTFHSFCARLLRRHIHRLLPYDHSFTIYDAEDSRGLLKEVLEELSIDQQVWTPRAAQERVSRMKNDGRDENDAKSPGWALRNLRERTIGEVYLRYVERLRERNALDFDDLLLLTLRLFDSAPDVLDQYRGQFRHVLIDEYQDTNGVQYRIGKTLTETHRNICITGDPDQSIYSWRGADIQNILNFEHDYPDARVVTLEKNYRSTGHILSVANSLIAHNEERLPKSLWSDAGPGEPVGVYRFIDEREEAREIAELVEKVVSEGTPPGDIAIFYRINALSRVVEQELIYANLPYSIVGGLEFFLRAEVKDILAYLRILANPRDSESAKRILNVPPRGIGKATLERLLERARKTRRGLVPTIVDLVGGEPEGRVDGGERLEGVDGVEPIERVDGLEGVPLGKRAASALEGFVAVYRRLRGACRGPVADAVQAIIEETRYEAFLRESGVDSGREKIANIWELHHSAKEYDDASTEGGIVGFLERANLLGDIDRWQRNEDRVSLMSLHSAKGLEFPVVVIAGVEDGILPLRTSAAEDDTGDIEEERRLLYVGITRARRLLYLTHTASRMRFGRTRLSVPSPFLRELIGGGGSPAAPSVEVDEETAQSLRAREDREPGAEWAESSEASVRFEDRVGASGLFPDDFMDGDEDPFGVGTKVFHEEYGAGVVKRISGVGPRRRITVAFEDGSEKQLVPGFSPLRRIR